MANLTFIIDGQDRGQPLNWRDFGIAIQRQKESNAIFTTFDSELFFSGNAYNYFFGKTYESSCQRIECVVLYSCDAAQHVVARGYIILNECSFDLDKCVVNCTFIDDAFQSKINANKSVEMWSNSEITKNNNSLLAAAGQSVQLFVPSTGNYLSRFPSCITVNNAFERLVWFMSDNSVQFRSDYFRTGAGRLYALTSGLELLASSQLIVRPTMQPFKCSFLQLFDALNKKLSLGFGFERNGATVTLRMEQSSFFLNNTNLVELIDVPGVTMAFDASKIYSAIELGSSEYLEEWQGDFNNHTLSFPQIPFRGFKGEQFGFAGVCNADNVYQNRTNRVIFDTNIIENIVMYDDQSYNDSPIIMQLNDTFSDASLPDIYVANQTDIYGINTFQYNADFINERQAANLIGGVPNSIWNYYTGINPNDALFEAEGSNTYYNETHGGWGNVLLFDLDQPTDIASSPVLLTERALVDGVGFDVENFDNGGNYQPNFTYYSPAPGIYEMRIQVALLQSSVNPVGQIAYIRPVITRYTPDGTLIKRTYGSFINYFVNGSGSVLIDETFNVFVNAGDSVSVDLQGYKTIAAAACYIIYAASNMLGKTQWDCLSVDLIAGGELQPTDASSLQGRVYRFKYPLTKNEINALLSDTTRGISFIREDDATSLMACNINRVTVSSLESGLAEIELTR